MLELSYMYNFLKEAEKQGVTIDDIISELDKDISRFCDEIRNAKDEETVEIFREELKNHISARTSWCSYREHSKALKR